MGSYEDFLKYHLCEKCSVAILMPHPQFPHKYIKCPLCGFTKKALKEDGSTGEE